MNSLIDKVESLINGTPSGDNRNELTNINITLHQQLNLCDGCKFHPAVCDSGDDITVGNGRGNDNVIKCETYVYKE